MTEEGPPHAVYLIIYLIIYLIVPNLTPWQNPRFYRLVGQGVWDRKNKKVSKFFVIFLHDQKPIDIVKKAKNKEEKTPFILSFILSFHASDRRERPIGFPWFPGSFPDSKR